MCIYIYILLIYRFIGYQHVLCFFFVPPRNDHADREIQVIHQAVPTPAASRKRHSRESMADPELWGTDGKIPWENSMGNWMCESDFMSKVFSIIV